MSAALSEHPDDGAELVGTYRRIGEIGPPYEVVAIARSGKVQICLLESGELVEYPTRDARQDPIA